MNKTLHKVISYLAHSDPVILPPLPAETREQLLQLTVEPDSSVAEQTPVYTRDVLEQLSGGRVATIFGPEYDYLDNYLKQVRVPMPPLLLIDRVMKIECEPLHISSGKIWTETDVQSDSWYVHDGRMPIGIAVEAGQANLILIGLMGIDKFNQGERTYRLLGANVIVHRGLPKVGDTINFEIFVDGVAKLGAIRLMFFHFEASINGENYFSVRNGQAGFFSQSELIESAGILWTPETAEFPANPRLDTPPMISPYRQFSAVQLDAFRHGDSFACFGLGFERMQTHVYSPRTCAGKLSFIHEITHFQPEGGPVKRGYLRAIQYISPDDWFFKCHFKNDPCMPGTMMIGAGVDLLSFYLAALGFTLDKDGWCFEPTLGHKIPVLCRGQCVPTTKEVIYELFINEIVGGVYPEIYAELLVTVDGLKGVYAKGMGVRLVPEWPLTRYPELLADYKPQKAAATVNGFTFDYPAILANAWGKPSAAFGDFYKKFDEGLIGVARLPGPPFLFLNRITEINGQLAAMQIGDSIVTEYDLPADAWYFADNSGAGMPLAVLMEVGLQPCGLLSTFTGCTLTSAKRLYYRNLDGVGQVFKEVTAAMTCLQTRVRLSRNFALQDTVIQSFAIEVFYEQERVMEMTATFGFFPEESFKDQAGLPVSPEQQRLLQQASDFSVDLRMLPEKYFAGQLHLARPKLLMLDRITGFWPQQGLGQLRAEKDVNMDEWFFKAHFYQDPVQPGSLGIEAMLQLLQFYMLERGMHLAISQPCFEPIALNTSLNWKYRGQVLPTNRLLTITMDITATAEDETSSYAMADASLWVDGKRIYEVRSLAMRIVSAGDSRLCTHLF